MFRDATAPESNTIIAALRLWQAVQEGHIALVLKDGGPCGLDYFGDTATCMGDHPALTLEEVNTLLDEVYGIA